MFCVRFRAAQFAAVAAVAAQFAQFASELHAELHTGSNQKMVGACFQPRPDTPEFGGQRHQNPTVCAAPDGHAEAVLENCCRAGSGSLLDCTNWRRRGPSKQLAWQAQAGRAAAPGRCKPADGGRAPPGATCGPSARAWNGKDALGARLQPRALSVVGDLERNEPLSLNQPDRKATS